MLFAEAKVKKTAQRNILIYLAILTVALFGAIIFVGLRIQPKPAPVAVGDCASSTYYTSDVLQHAKCTFSDPDANDLWIVIDGRVYDVSKWSACK